MRTRIAVVTAAVLVAACGKDTCPTESPPVNAVGSCTVVASQSVSYPIKLCPTCNQTLSSCNAQISGTQVFLDPIAEACTSSNSCPPPSCPATPSTCTFTAPGTPGSYTVFATDGATGAIRQGTMTVIASGALDCAPL